MGHTPISGLLCCGSPSVLIEKCSFQLSERSTHLRIRAYPVFPLSCVAEKCPFWTTRSLVLREGRGAPPSLNPGLILFLVVPRLRGAQQLGYERFRRSVSSRREEYVRANLIKICINSPSADGAQIWGTVSFSPRACPCVFYL